MLVHQLCHSKLLKNSRIILWNGGDCSNASFEEIEKISTIVLTNINYNDTSNKVEDVILKNKTVSNLNKPI